MKYVLVPAAHAGNYWEVQIHYVSYNPEMTQMTRALTALACVIHHRLWIIADIVSLNLPVIAVLLQAKTVRRDRPYNILHIGVGVKHPRPWRDHLVSAVGKVWAVILLLESQLTSRSNRRQLIPPAAWGTA